MLSQNHKAMLEQVRAIGGGSQGVALSDEQCVGLLSIVVSDLGLSESFPELPLQAQAFFDIAPETLEISSLNLPDLFERLVDLNKDSDTYFRCLATLHKSRIKYKRILSTQPIPTLDQVGPRGLLQYGMSPSRELAALLYWRKWMFDIDNRAGQETGYLFEPIIASAIGGVSVGARNSPVKRRRDRRKGRQVDCIKERQAYEIKLRVTIAASGQGRWQEELDFPQDAVQSEFTPVLIVLDPTPNEKLTELAAAFTEAGGRAYIGNHAWDHLDNAAGETMANFLRNYVRVPLEDLLESAPADLPDLKLSMDADRVIFRIGDVEHTVSRAT